MMRRNCFYGFLALLVIACATPAPARAAADKPARPKPVIGVSLLTLTNPFFLELGEAMKAEAAKHGMEVVLTAGEFDVAKQRNQVNDFIVKRVSAIVLCPCDSKAIGTSIAAANKAGIPVFTADIASLADPKTAKVEGHVATDNYGGGKLAAKAIIEALGGSGKVAVLDHPEVESVLLRTKGFEEEIAKHNESGGGKIRIVTKLPGGGAKDRSFKAAEDILQAHPDLNGLFAINDPSALGAVAALEKAGKLANVKVVGFDGQPEGKQAIKDGKIFADPIQFPDRLGRETAKIIARYFQGEEVPFEILIPTSLYRREDGLKDPSLR